MKVQVLQHVPFEGVGSMAAWLAAHKAEVRVTRFFEDPSLPEPGDQDLVIVMGGPMSANDEAELPWLAPEKRFLRQAVAAGTGVLGVCLGAQLLASAFGARVFRNKHKEIGWFPITGIPGPAGTFAFPGECPAFHWHGETFELPAGAAHLARSAACENQAFQIGERALGLQFHLETTPESLAGMTVHCADELVAGEPYIQGAERMLAASAADFAALNGLMDRVLAYLTR